VKEDTKGKREPLMADEDASPVDGETRQPSSAGVEEHTDQRKPGHENREIDSCKSIVNGTHDALREGQNSEEKYRKLFEFSHDSLMTLSGPSYLFSSGNPATCRMFGANNEAEFISLSPWELSPEFQPDGQSSNEKAREMIEKAITEGSAFFPWTHRRLNGEEFPATVLLTSTEINGEIVVQATVRDITNSKLAEESIARQNNSLAELNRFAIELSSLPPEANLEAFIAKRLKEIFGAKVATFSDYNPETKTITAKHIEMDSGVIGKIVGLLGKKIQDVHSVVTDEMYNEMTSEHIGRRKTLYEATFGAVPRPVAAAIQALLRADRFIGMAYLVEGKLYGSSLLAIGKGEPEPHKQVLENFSLLAATALLHKREEEALRQSEEKYKNLAEGIKDIAYSSDVEGNILYIGPQVSRYGLTQANMVGRGFVNFIHPDDREKLIADFTETMTTGREMRTEFRILDEKGNAHWFEEVGKLEKDKTGAIIKITGVLRDITERKQSEEDLRKSEERFRNVIDATGDYIFEVDARGIITFISNRVRDILGYEPRELIGKTPFDLIGSPEEVARMSLVFGERLANKRPMKGEEHTCTSKDGREITVSVTAQPIFNEAGEVKGYQGAVEDITNRKRAEEERRSLERQLAHAQKIEAIGLLAGGVAHDINNNLVPIFGYTELVMDELDPNSTMKSDLEQVMKAGRSAAELVKNLLAFSRKQPLALSPEDIGSIVDSFMSTIGVHVGAEIAINTKMSQDLWVAMVDISEVEAILGNLVTNAMHAMPDGGILLLETRNIHLDEKSLPKCEGAYAGDFVLLSIEDTGTGISPENLSLIYEPYFTTKGEGKGSGLGLARTFGTIHQLGGFITVKSKVGSGTRFELYFPAAGVNAKISAKKETRERLYKGDETIIVVDDDESVRKLTARILSECGYRVKMAENAGSAYIQIEKMKSEGKPVHLVLTDISMENVRGPALGKRIKKEYPDIEVCYMSGYPQSDNPDLEGLEIISKPFSGRDLSKRIREALDAKKKKDSQEK